MICPVEPKRSAKGLDDPTRAEGGVGRWRLWLSYAIAVAIAVAALAGIITVISGSDYAHSGTAHINQATGSTNGVPPDYRQGSSIPPVKVASLEKAARIARCNVRLKLTDEGHKHIPFNAPKPIYKTNPPTSGPHVEAPYQQADGAYRATPAEIAFVHSLEHGRLEIQYSKTLSEQDQRALIGMYDTMYGGTLLFPNEQMPYVVAAVTWRNLLGCSEYRGAITLDAIRDFGRTTWGRYGGQPVNSFERSAPTPFEPALGD